MRTCLGGGPNARADEHRESVFSALAAVASADGVTLPVPVRVNPISGTHAQLVATIRKRSRRQISSEPGRSVCRNLKPIGQVVPQNLPLNHRREPLLEPANTRVISTSKMAPES